MSTIASALLVCIVLLCGFARRGGLRALAIGFALNWLLFVTSWTPDWSVATFAHHAGWYVESPSLWALADACMGMACIALAFGRWWGWALWSTYTLQCVMHVAYQAGWSWGQYKLGLDTVFLIQVSIFVLAGGKGAFDYGQRIFTDRGGRLRSVRLGRAVHRAGEKVSGR